jgi:hypothetical protein
MEQFWSSVGVSSDPTLSFVALHKSISVEYEEAHLMGGIKSTFFQLRDVELVMNAHQTRRHHDRVPYGFACLALGTVQCTLN